MYELEAVTIMCAIGCILSVLTILFLAFNYKNIEQINEEVENATNEHLFKKNS